MIVLKKIEKKSYFKSLLLHRVSIIFCIPLKNSIYFVKLLLNC